MPVGSVRHLHGFAGLAHKHVHAVSGLVGLLATSCELTSACSCTQKLPCFLQIALPYKQALCSSHALQSLML